MVFSHLNANFVLALIEIMRFNVCLKMEDLFSNLNELLECPICTELFQDPILIVSFEGDNRCLHRFCRECVEKLMTSRRNNSKCPGEFQLVY